MLSLVSTQVRLFPFAPQFPEATTNAVTTDTEHCAVKPPLTEVAVIIAVPSAILSTKPLLVTVATAGLLLLHVTALLEVQKGNTFAVSCSVVFGNKSAVLLLKVIPLTALVYSVHVVVTFT